MFEDDNVRIRHILDAAREAVAFTKGRSRAVLDKDRKLNLSLVRLLEIIGEAARGISEEFRGSHPDICRGKVWLGCGTGLFIAILTLIST